MNQSTTLSLYIPHVFGNITKEYMKKTIEFQGLGKVNKIDFVEKISKNGKIYNTAFVHFEYWYDNIVANHFKSRVKDTNKEARIVYKDPWFWVCFENKGKKHIPGERKETINLNDFSNVFTIEEEKNELNLSQDIEDKFEHEILEEFNCNSSKISDVISYKKTDNCILNQTQINEEYVRHLEMLNYKLIHDLYELRGDFIMT